MGTKPHACPALMVLALAALPLPAAAPPPARDRAIVTLISQLGGDTYAGRNEAARKLEKIGPPALPELRSALRSPDVEIRRRARRILNRIETHVFYEVRQFPGHRGSVNAVAFSPDGKRALSGDSGGLHLWDVATGKEVARNEGHRDRVMAVAFSPDGKYIASGSEDRKAMLLDAATMKELKLLSGHRADVRSVIFCRDGKRLVSGDLQGGVCVWSVPDGKLLARLPKAGSQKVFSLALLDEHRVIVAPGRGNEAVLRTLSEKDNTFVELTGHKLSVMSVAVSRDGKSLVTASHDQMVLSWDVKTGKPIHNLKGHTAAACCVAVSADGTIAVSGGADRRLLVWDLVSSRLIRGLQGHTNTIWSVAISPDGKYALSGSADGTMRLWTVSP